MQRAGRGGGKRRDGEGTGRKTWGENAARPPRRLPPAGERVKGICHEPRDARWETVACNGDGGLVPGRG